MTSHQHDRHTCSPAPEVLAQRTAVEPWFATAAALGTLHAAFSVYWGMGGHWLEETLGHRIVEQFASERWVLILVGAVKMAAACTPLLAVRRGLFTRSLRVTSWCGALVLLAWGGVSMITAQLALAGVFGDGHPTDRAGLIGHAWLWDPLFVLWGSALVVGLRRYSRFASRWS